MDICFLNQETDATVIKCKWALKQLYYFQYSFNTAEKQSWTVPEHLHKSEHAFTEKQGFKF